MSARADEERTTCEICDEGDISKCRSCNLSGEPNPEAFTRPELIDALVLCLFFPREPWRLVHLGDTSVAGQPRWEAILHRPLRDDREFMFASKFGQGASATEALQAASAAREDRVMRYVTVARTARAPGQGREGLVVVVGDEGSDGEELF